METTQPKPSIHNSKWRDAEFWRFRRQLEDALRRVDARLESVSSVAAQCSGGSALWSGISCVFLSLWVSLGLTERGCAARLLAHWYSRRHENLQGLRITGLPRSEPSSRTTGILNLLAIETQNTDANMLFFQKKYSGNTTNLAARNLAGLAVS